MSEFDSGEDCPLCVEPMDEADRAYRPCKCGFGVCLFCWHKINNTGNGLCPACRSPYDATNYKVLEVDITKPAKKPAGKVEPRKPKPTSSYTPSTYVPTRVTSTSREALRDVRVIQRNLVYVVGLNPAITREEVLRRPEYFGQYGRVMKVVGNRNYIPATDGRPASASAYVTFYTQQAAADAIRACDGFPLDDRTIHCSFGTSKYCHQYLRGNSCTNPECLYLHEVGDSDDSFTKEDMQMQSRQAFHDLTHPPQLRGAPGSGPDAPPLPPAPSTIRQKGQTVLPSLPERYYGVGVATGCGFVPYPASGVFEEEPSEGGPPQEDENEQGDYAQGGEYGRQDEEEDRNSTERSNDDAQQGFTEPNVDTTDDDNPGNQVPLNGIVSPVETVPESSLGKSLGDVDIWLPPDSVGLLGGDLLSGHSTPGGIGGDILLGGSHPALDPHVLSGIAGLGLSLPTFTPAPLAEELSFVNDLSALLSNVGATPGLSAPAHSVSNSYPQAQARSAVAVDNGAYTGHSSMFTPMQPPNVFSDSLLATRFPSMAHQHGGQSQQQSRVSSDFGLPSLSSPPRHPQHSMIEPEPLLMRGASSYTGYPQHQSYDQQRQRQGMMASPYRAHYMDRDGYSVDTVTHSSPPRPGPGYPQQQYRQYDQFGGDAGRFERPGFGFDDSTRRYHDSYQRPQGPASLYGDLHSSDHSMQYRDPAILHSTLGNNPPTPLRNATFHGHHTAAVEGPSLQDLLSSIVGNSSNGVSSSGLSYSLDPLSQRPPMPRRGSVDHQPASLHFSSTHLEHTPPMQPASYPHPHHGLHHDDVLSSTGLGQDDPPTPIVTTASSFGDNSEQPSVVVMESESPADTEISPKSVVSDDGARPPPVNTASTSRPPVSLARRSPNMYIPPKRTVTTDNGNVITTVITQPSPDVIIAEAIPASSGASSASRSSSSAATRTASIKTRGVYKPGQHNASGTYITTATAVKPVVIELNVPAPAPAPASGVDQPVVVLPSAKPVTSGGRGGKFIRGGKRY